MRHPDKSCHQKKTYHVPYAHNAVLPEHIIMDLHEIFLSKGIHHLEVVSYSSARQLIVDILDSVKYYQNIAYLSIESRIPWYEKVFFHDLYTLIKECGYLHTPKEQLELFFIEAFFFDFLIIEESNSLIANRWYQDFLQAIIYSSLESQLPIIMVRAQEA